MVPDPAPKPASERHRLEELRAIYREGGPRALAWRVARSLVARVLWLETDVVVAKELTGGATWRGRANLDVRPLPGFGDPAFHELLHHAGSERLARWCSSYARNGYHAFLAVRDGDPIGLMWWVDARIPEPRNHPHLKRFAIRLGGREAYLFDFFIRTDHRGGGNANEFMLKIEAALASRGYERLLGCVDVENKQARWLYSLLGWKDVQTYQCWTLFKFVLLTNRALFVRNGPKNSPHGFDFRRIYPPVGSH